MRLVLPALALGNFAIATGGFVLPGMLAPLSTSLGLTVVAAGQFLTIYAVAYAVGSPALVALTGRIGRRPLLVIALLTVALANLLSALADGFWTLALGRVLAAAGAAVYTPTASTVAIVTSPPERRGKALAVVFLGMGFAQVLGIPAGTMVAYALGWRLTFVLIAVLALAAAAALARLIPDGLTGQTVSLAAWSRVLRDPRIALALAVTLLQFTGQFLPYSYIGPWLAAALGLSATGVSALLWTFGVSSTLGAVVGGWSSDRFGIVPTLAGLLAILAASLALTSIGVGALAPMALGMMGWGMAGFAYNAPQQSRLVTLAPEAMGIVLALNASALYIGTAAGAAIGGIVIATIGINALGAIGGLFTLGSIAALWASARARPRWGEPGAQ